MLSAQRRPADGPAAYTAHERFTGSVQGRQDTFVSRHGAAAGPEGGRTWTIVTGSGTHAFALDYERS